MQSRNHEINGIGFTYWVDGTIELFGGFESVETNSETLLAIVQYIKNNPVVEHVE